MKNGRVVENGNIRYYQNDQLHREDGPAVEFANGDKEWWQNGKRHREDGPAVDRTNGDKFWFLDGKHHRVDGPAVERGDGYKAWLINGEEIDLLSKLKETLNTDTPPEERIQKALRLLS